MFKRSTCLIVFAYGVLLIGLGYLGYQQSGSTKSLMMGSGFGLLVLLSSGLLFAKNKLGTYLAILTTIALTATFITRYSSTGKMVPGCLAVISGIMLVFLFSESTKERKLRKKSK
jgi:uncharacterized membrane protein (UPF0136 family)